MIKYEYNLRQQHIMYSRGQKAGECEHSPKYSKILYSLESSSGIEIAMFLRAQMYLEESIC